MVRFPLSEAEWPDTDLALWARLTAPSRPLDEPGALSHLRESSLVTMRAAYGRWLGWLRDSDPGALVEGPVERTTIARLGSWSRSLAHLSARSRLIYLEHALKVLSAAAPDADWLAARRILRKPRHEANAMTSDRKTVRVLSSAVLFEAGAAEIEAAGTDPAPDAARRWRDGMMVALLAILPIRRRAFAALELGRSILRRGKTLTIVLDASLTKTGEHWEAIVPTGCGAAQSLSRRDATGSTGPDCESRPPSVVRR